MTSFDDADSDVGEGASVRYFRQILVENALNKVLTEDVLTSCVQDQLTIILNAPTETWANALMGPLAARCHSIPSHERPFVFKRSHVRRARADKSDPDLNTILAKLLSGVSVIGVCYPASEPLPEFTAAIDIRLEIPRPSYADVAKALTNVTGTAVDSGQIPPINTLDLDALTALIRPRASIEQTLQRLRAVAGSTPKDDGVPSLHELAGYGEAKTWALGALRVIERIRAGDPDTTLSDLPRGALLAGPPGTGKSIFAKSLAKTLNIPSVITSVSDWLSTGDTHLGTVIGAARASIEKATAYQPGLLFIDEVDSLVDRDLEKGHSAGWWINFINAVLSGIDGAIKTPGLVVVGACNDLDRVDKALTRSGRLETIVRIGLPGEQDRLAIFELYVRGAVSRDDLKACAARAAGMSGADIYRVVREARQATRDDGRSLDRDALLAAMAPRDRLCVDELGISARHEAGHALAAMLLGDRLVAVDIDRAVTHLKPMPAVLSGPALDQAITILLAGRAADQILAGEVNSGAGGAPLSDLGQATALAAARHTSFGLGQTLAFVGQIQDGLRLIEIDRELRRIVEQDLQEAYKKTLALLADHEFSLRALANELLQRRFMPVAELDRFMAGLERAEP